MNSTSTIGWDRRSRCGPEFALKCKLECLFLSFSHSWFSLYTGFPNWDLHTNNKRKDNGIRRTELNKKHCHFWSSFGAHCYNWAFVTKRVIRLSWFLDRIEWIHSIEIKKKWCKVIEAKVIFFIYFYLYIYTCTYRAHGRHSIDGSMSDDGDGDGDALYQIVLSNVWDLSEWTNDWIGKRTNKWLNKKKGRRGSWREEEEEYRRHMLNVECLCASRGSPTTDSSVLGRSHQKIPAHTIESTSHSPLNIDSLHFVYTCYRLPSFIFFLLGKTFRFQQCMHPALE